MSLDVALPEVNAEFYLETEIGERLAVELAESLPRRTYAELWLAGISLGGMGAIAYARAHAGRIAGLLLLAPFLGLPDENRRPELLAQIADARLPGIYLGYGRQDRYARASELLAQRLPPERVTTIDGGHDWPTWSRLWGIMLGQAFAP
jgi:pimeloyl-ACP methyl ester carboxylesterase